MGLEELEAHITAARLRDLRKPLLRWARTERLRRFVEIGKPMLDSVAIRATVQAYLRSIAVRPGRTMIGGRRANHACSPYKRRTSNGLQRTCRSSRRRRGGEGEGDSKEEERTPARLTECITIKGGIERGAIVV